MTSSTPGNAVSSMQFESILFPDPSAPATNVESTALARDLSLGRIIDAVTADWKEYNLKPFFYDPLTSLATVIYRQDVIGDLQDEQVMRSVRSFSDRMAAMRAALTKADEAKKLDYSYSAQRLFLAAVASYCDGVGRLSRDLEMLPVKSHGLIAFRSYVSEYVGSADFGKLAADTRKLTADLSGIRYCLLIEGGNVTVRHYNGEEDYAEAVERTFEKFRGDSPAQYRLEHRKWEGMNHIEAQVQERVALLYPEMFGALAAFCLERADYLDEKIARFDREIHFYIAYLTHLEKFRSAGLIFCRPRLSRTSKQTRARDAFDLALAGTLVRERTPVVTNDFWLSEPERIFVVSGPNQGGKTTFARMVGQMHYLASLGCPVPGSEACLFLCDRVLTHFERAEDIGTLRGKLQDDLTRIREILNLATPDSLIIMNEMFSSTTLKDALYLSKKVMARISSLDALGVWVTFLDEIASLNEKTVSIVSTVDPEDPARRTYKLERRAADGLAYAFAIAQKHRVTYHWLKERIQG